MSQKMFTQSFDMYNFKLVLAYVKVLGEGPIFHLPMVLSCVPPISFVSIYT